MGLSTFKLFCLSLLFFLLLAMTSSDVTPPVIAFSTILRQILCLVELTSNEKASRIDVK